MQGSYKRETRNTGMGLIAFVCCLETRDEDPDEKEKALHVLNVSPQAAPVAEKMNGLPTKPAKKPKEVMEMKEVKEAKEVKEVKEVKDVRVVKDVKDVKETKGMKEASDYPKSQKDVLLNLFALTLEEVKEATGGFEQEAYLGEGSSGRVFQGQLRSGVNVAIKVLKSAQQPEREFLEQVAKVARLRHVNVTALLGFCIDGDTRMLAYELAPYGSLHDVLHGWKGIKGSKPGPLLHWPQRIKIAMGVAKGLLYLHEQALTTFAHKGIKSSNIMLFNDYVAKLGDFNLSKEQADPAAPFDPQHEFSREMLPENVQAEKADIYNFGVVLLELLTGRRPVDPTAPHNQQSLVTWAMPRLSADKVQTIVDPRLKARYPDEGPLRLGFVAALCMDDLDYRPSISTIITALQPLLSMPMPLRSSPRQTRDGFTRSVTSNSSGSRSTVRM